MTEWREEYVRTNKRELQNILLKVILFTLGDIGTEERAGFKKTGGILND